MILRCQGNRAMSIEVLHNCYIPITLSLQFVTLFIHLLQLLHSIYPTYSLHYYYILPNYYNIYVI